MNHPFALTLRHPWSEACVETRRGASDSYLTPNEREVSTSLTRAGLSSVYNLLLLEQVERYCLAQCVTPISWPTGIVHRLRGKLTGVHRAESLACRWFFLLWRILLFDVQSLPPVPDGHALALRWCRKMIVAGIAKLL